MSASKMTIGNVTIIALSDGKLNRVIVEAFPGSQTQVWKCGCSAPGYAPDFQLNLGSFLVGSGDRTILVDTGIGPRPPDDSSDTWGLLLTDFEEQGLDVEQVDTVFMTHMHYDHAGWNLRKENGKLAPTLPNARYIGSARDWAFFSQQPDAQESYNYQPFLVEPLQELGLLDLVDGEYSLTSELTAFPTPGHTPGHMSILISSQGERGIILGDVAHHPFQVRETGWGHKADIDPDGAIETRRAVMDRIEAEGLRMAAGHFPAPGFGEIIRLEGKRYWKAL
ncbi:MAG: MBL fold metallo-hydrolase [Dehalococcoidia bacterium]